MTNEIQTEAATSLYREKGHAPGCGVMFRTDRVCTCAVGEADRLRQSLDFWSGIVRTFWRFAGVDSGKLSEPRKVNETNGFLWELRRERDDAVAEVARLREVPAEVRESVAYWRQRAEDEERRALHALAAANAIKGERDRAAGERDAARAALRDAQGLGAGARGEAFARTGDPAVLVRGLAAPDSRDERIAVLVETAKGAWAVLDRLAKGEHVAPENLPRVAAALDAALDGATTLSAKPAGAAS